MEGGGRELQVHWAFRKVAKWKKNTFLLCFCSPGLPRVEGEESRCVGVKFLAERVLKPQNTIIHESNHKNNNNFGKKIALSSIARLTLRKFTEEFSCNIYFDKTNSCTTLGKENLGIGL